ncbi:hypothetical protein [Evansella tamaricis]|uniref:Phage protein n=1 Tax=Evansella tamaricis TaxID=2069301 RepID=A0ABS6JFA5_9BACI|nr:hypothetical protein [Evansella tamaricis]MBU9712354.1 hypothetical protein [Evansella tamaricis]
MIIEEPYDVTKELLHAVDIYLMNREHAQQFLVEGDGHVAIFDHENNNYFIIPEGMVETALTLGYSVVKD